MLIKLLSYCLIIIGLVLTYLNNVTKKFEDILKVFEKRVNDNKLSLEKLVQIQVYKENSSWNLRNEKM